MSLIKSWFSLYWRSLSSLALTIILVAPFFIVSIWSASWSSTSPENLVSLIFFYILFNLSLGGFVSLVQKKFVLTFTSKLNYIKVAFLTNVDILLSQNLLLKYYDWEKVQLEVYISSTIKENVDLGSTKLEDLVHSLPSRRKERLRFFKEKGFSKDEVKLLMKLGDLEDVSLYKFSMQALRYHQGYYDKK